MKSNPWGMVTWTLFHTLIELLPDEKYNTVGEDLFNQIKSLCTVLPCPSCSTHATHYLRNVRYSQIPSKMHMKLFFHQFHNTVNHRTNKPIESPEILEKYKLGNLMKIYRVVYGLFTKNYGNTRMMMYTIRRKHILSKLYQFIKTHY